MSFLLDNFTEASDIALASHTPDTGGAWSVGSGTWTVIATTDEVQSNARDFAWNAATPPTADYYVEISGKTVGTLAGDQFGGIMRSSANARLNASGNRYWFAAGGTGVVDLNKEVAGVTSNLGSYTIVGFSASTNYLIRGTCSGTTIGVDVDGVNRISVTDTAHSGAGLAGLYTRNSQQLITSIDAVDTGVAQAAASVAGGSYSVPRKRKKLIIDGKTYTVSPQEEAQLVQAHIDRLNDEKREAEVEVKSQQKLLRIAKSTAPKKSDKTPAQVFRVETRIADIMESLQEIDVKRREAKERKAQIEFAIDEEEAMSLILSMEP